MTNIVYVGDKAADNNNYSIKHRTPIYIVV